MYADIDNRCKYLDKDLIHWESLSLQRVPWTLVAKSSERSQFLAGSLYPKYGSSISQPQLLSKPALTMN